MKRTILALGVVAALFATSATASADPGHRGGYNHGGYNQGGFGYSPGAGGGGYRSAYPYAGPYRAYGSPGYGYGGGYGYGSQPGFSLGVARPGLSFGFNLFR